MALFRKKPKPAPVVERDTSALSPVVKLILADLALRLGDRLVRRGVEQSLLEGHRAKTGRVIRGNTLRETVIGTVAAAVARRSVPGAIIVSGGLIAKTLRDRRRARTAVAVKKPRRQD